MIPFGEAVKVVKQAHLNALLYTTANYKEKTPKWRILLPASCDLPPAERKKLVARVNGLFGGVFAHESFRLSQSYYFGSVNSNPSHRAEVVEGDYIDLRDDLDAGAIYETKGPVGNKDPRGFEQHLARLGDGSRLDGFNGPLCSATAAYTVRHGTNLDRDALKARLRRAIERAPKGADRNPDDITRYLGDGYLDNLIASAIEKFAVGVSLEDFSAYMPMHNYIYMPSREPWPASSVNARLGSVPLLDPDGEPVLNEKGEQVEIAANAWLDRNRPVEQMTWAPGLPALIKDRLVSDGGWIEKPKVTCLNLYKPPMIESGNAAQAGRWLDHVKRVYPDDHEHIVEFLAHRVQRPQEKINHALLLGGEQGIGKDTILEPVKYAVGPWNFREVSPHHLLGRFNGFIKSVILRVNEARDLGDTNRYQFYDHMKAYTAAPPDVLTVDEKHLREHSVFNCCGVIITTNYKTDGVYLPAGDRRHYVAWSNVVKEDFGNSYWNGLWHWYEKEGGICHVASYLAQLEISAFDPKAPPKKTAAFWDIVDADRAPEDAELADLLDRLKNPAAVTLTTIAEQAIGSSFFDWINDRKNRRAIPHRFEQCGYVPVRNDTAGSGLWVINEKRQVVYAKADLSLSDRLRAARGLKQ